MEKELQGLIANGTFTEAIVPAGRKPVGAKWIFKLKTNQFGEVTRPKARMVAKGFSQIPGVDFDGTYAPTPAASSIRLLVATSLENDLDLFHLDAEQAFVQSDVDTETFMRIPPWLWRIIWEVCPLE